MENTEFTQIQLEAQRLGITYIDPRLDFAFKSVFGTKGNEDLLLKLVNAILPDRNITSVELSNQEQKGLRSTSRSAVFDIFCNTSDGSELIIEMQYRDQKDFNQRMVFYSSFPIQNKIFRGKKPGELRLNYSFSQLIVVGISDFILDDVPANDSMINSYSIRNDRYREIVFTDKVQYVTVELPKLTKSLKDLTTPADYLFYAIRNIGKMHRMPAEYEGSGLDKFFEMCKFAAMTEAEQRQYLAELMEELDQGSREKTAWDRGWEQGKAEGWTEGKAKGKAEDKIETARELKRLGVSADIICQATKLPPEEVEKL